MRWNFKYTYIPFERQLHFLILKKFYNPYNKIKKKLICKTHRVYYQLAKIKIIKLSKARQFSMLIILRIKRQIKVLFRDGFNFIEKSYECFRSLT